MAGYPGLLDNLWPVIWVALYQTIRVRNWAMVLSMKTIQNVLYLRNFHCIHIEFVLQKPDIILLCLVSYLDTIFSKMR